MPGFDRLLHESRVGPGRHAGLSFLQELDARMGIMLADCSDADVGANKKRNMCCNSAVANIRNCAVKFRDGEGVEHPLEVAASSLYEAAGLALQRFRRCDWSRQPSFEAGTLEVEVWDQPTLHRVKVAELVKWLKREGWYTA
jgi:hypothetical protein